MGYIYSKGLSSMAFFQRVPTPQWSIKIWIPLVMGKPSWSSSFSVTPAVNSDVLGSAWVFRCFMSKLQHWWKAEVFSSRQECVISVLLLSTVLTQVMGMSSIRKKDICTCEWHSLLCKYPKTLLKKTEPWKQHRRKVFTYIHWLWFIWEEYKKIIYYEIALTQGMSLSKEVKDHNTENCQF